MAMTCWDAADDWSPPRRRCQSRAAPARSDLVLLPPALG
jgi:hypothetical protein